MAIFSSEECKATFGFKNISNKTAADVTPLRDL